jgi:biopolymer transport protein ExbD
MLIRARERADNRVSIDLTPIIDMVFLLLIFFLVATTFHQAEREMKVALPYASSAGPISSALREIVVNVLEDGSIVMSGRTVTLDELKASIEQAVKLNPEQKVSLRGDRAATYQKVHDALTVIRDAGVQEPYLDSVLER